MEQLIVTIKNGAVELDVEGVKGSHCIELTQAIEKLIGDTDQRLFKNDFYQAAVIAQCSTLNQRLKKPQ